MPPPPPAGSSGGGGGGGADHREPKVAAEPRRRGVAFGLIWVGFVAYLGVLAAAPRLGAASSGARSRPASLAFACRRRLLSHDVYSYVDYARLGVLHGLDPYVYPPDAAPADPAFAHVTWTETTSAYGPLFTLGTYPLAWLPVGSAVYVLKARRGGAVLATAALVARLAPASRRRPAARRRLRRPQPARPRPRRRRPPQRRPGDPADDARRRRRPLRREASGGAAFVAAVAIKASAAPSPSPFALLGPARRPSGFLLRRLSGGSRADGAAA